MTQTLQILTDFLILSFSSVVIRVFRVRFSHTTDLMQDSSSFLFLLLLSRFLAVILDYAYYFPYHFEAVDGRGDDYRFMQRVIWFQDDLLSLAAVPFHSDAVLDSGDDDVVVLHILHFPK